LKERAYIYLGDELGYLKIWDLSTFLKEFKINVCKSYIEMKGSFNPTRKENIDCSFVTK
jgi:hypothetical protein